MPTIAEQVAVYVEQLILQYRRQPKARATVGLYVQGVIGGGDALAVQAAFSVETAVGAQLDIIGKYVGVPRNIGDPVPTPYFGLWDYASARDPALYKGTWDPATDTPTLPAAAGGNAGWWYVAIPRGTSTAPIAATFEQGDVIFSDGATWAKSTVNNGNGFTDYTNGATNAGGVFYSYAFSGSLNIDLTDAQYRAVIKLKIIENSNDGTLATIQQLLFDFFGGLVLLTDNADMTMDYQVAAAVGLPTTVLETYLPRPMGVGITINGGAGASGRLTTEGGDYLTTEAGDYIVTT